MKKILCIILALSTLATMLVVGITVNAAEAGKVENGYTPEGTAITSAAEFAAMAADGKYYLANDITVDATYANAFTGTFDGNGKTVTISVPLFADLAGNVKNLTVNNGELVDESGADMAAIAVTTSGNVTFDNIVNNANITGTAQVGALIADTVGDNATITIKNCVNNGAIKGKYQVGGLIGRINASASCTLVVENCVNNGKIESTSYAGSGLIATAGKSGIGSDAAKTLSTAIKNCVNNGEVIGEDRQGGGILGYSVGVLTMDNCENNGNVTNVKKFAGGILGTTSTEKNESAYVITNCVNNGKVTAGTIAAGITCYAGRKVAQISGMCFGIESCANYGEIIAKADVPSDAVYATGIVGYAYGGTNSKNYVKNCLNAGNISLITGTTTENIKISGHVGYINGASYTFANNINVGIFTISIGETDASKLAKANTICQVSTAAPTKTTNNYAISQENIPLATTKADGFVYTDDMVRGVTAEQVASGELVYTLNEAAGETIYYQDLATGKITLTAAEDGSNTVIKNADGTYSNPVVEGGDNTTTPEGDVTTTPEGDVTTTVPTPEDTTTVPTPEDTTTAPTGDDTTTLPDLDCTTTPTDETTAPADDTTTIGLDTTTAKPVDTTAKPTDTTVAPEEKSCGGFALAAQLIALLGTALTVVVIKKK